MNLELVRKMDRIHPYPAKFTVDLALENVEKYSKEDDVIYDPFLGSGTTLLASKLLGRNGFGTDINFIAILISKFKLLNLNSENFKNLEIFIKDFEENYKAELKDVVLFNYQSIEHWFCNSSIKVLSLIKSKIELLNNENEKIFCNLVFSSIINLASNQDSDTRYAAVEKPQLNEAYVVDLFINKFITALNLYKEFIFECDFSRNKNVPILLNAKKCSELIQANSVDLILTSPPYPNTYDYYLYHKHRMNWLGYDVKFSMQNEIGSRREFSSLKKPKEKFNDDMLEILTSCDKTLKIGGHVVLVMGDGRIQGEIYEAKSNIENICKNLNWDLVDYSYSLLDVTSRSFQQSYRTKGKKEHVLVFKKEL